MSEEAIANIKTGDKPLTIGAILFDSKDVDQPLTRRDRFTLAIVEGTLAAGHLGPDSLALPVLAIAMADRLIAALGGPAIGSRPDIETPPPKTPFDM